MKKLILRNFQSPGDIVMLTAAVRDLHRSCLALWENNPYLTPLADDDPDAEVIDCEYPLIHSSNTRPCHFLHGFVEFLGERIDRRIAVTDYRGDIHISDQEKAWFSRIEEIKETSTPFWLIVPGGKHDHTIKWWDHDRYQQVVDHFRGRIEFVQVGEEHHHHPPLEHVIDLRGQTDLRQLVRLPIMRKASCVASACRCTWRPPWR